MHLLVHKEEKGYVCKVCSKAFRRSKDLKVTMIFILKSCSLGSCKDFTSSSSSVGRITTICTPDVGHINAISAKERLQTVPTVALTNYECTPPS
jgi:hypothetical protein